MQKLMIAADVLVSDYSSCIWDFSLMFKPCFLFTPDLNMYDQTFAFYTPIYDWGFKVCQSNCELVESVKSFNSEAFINAVNDNHRLFGNSETGAAIEYVYKYIIETN